MQHGGWASIQDATTLLTPRGLLASLSDAPKYLADYRPSGGGSHTLTRSTSGILFFDDFNRADGSLGGNWVTDTGTWAISSNRATNSSAGNFDRCRNTTFSGTDAMYEHSIKCPGSGIYAGLRGMAPSSSADWHQWAVGNNTDNRLSQGASTDSPSTGSVALGMDTTNFHVIKVLYITSKTFVVWANHVVKLGTIASPFSFTGSPTAAGNVGLMAYGGAALFDWVLVSSDYKITVTGLSGTQAFRLFDGSHTVIGSSSTQSSGSATIDITTLVDGLITGTVEVYDSTSWGTLLATYPSVGTAVDIAGGDLYTFA